jgi:uncharacterized protein involved in type VI secretion and phage assembly
VFTPKPLTAISIREERNKIYGVVIGIVTNNKDTSGKYRVKVRFPWLPNGDESGQTSEESDWCRIATFMAGNGRGMFCLPEVGDEVLVAFEHGDIGRPYVIGSVWNDKDKPTGDNKGGKNNLRGFKSRSGHVLMFCDDKDNGEYVSLTTNGKATIKIDDKDNKIEITDHSGKNGVVVDSKNNKISVKGEDKLDINCKGDYTIKCNKFYVETGADCQFKVGGNYEMKASSNMTLKASGSGDVESSGAMTIKGSKVNIN